MLRIRRVKTGRSKPSLRVDYEDPYLALTSLLVDAATLEHSLLSVYLYALFSIRERYKDVRGELSSESFQSQPPGKNAMSGQAPRSAKATFLDVTIEEMQHLAMVNQLLYELCAAPCLERHTFPHRFEIYPFPLELRSLDRYVAATFTWIEAPAAALKRSSDNRLVEELEGVVNREANRNVVREREDKGLEPLGSLYNQILERLDTLRKDPPPFIPNSFAWGVWSDRIDWIRNQGEIDHFGFFRSLFEGSAFGGNASIWKLAPEHEVYPATKLEWKSAFRGRDSSISQPGEVHEAQGLAWLSNLIYWTLLCLLDVSYRTNNRKLIYVAIEQMASGLWWLGLELAHVYELGMPFDVMLVRYNLGRDERSTLQIIERLVREARHVAELPEVAERLPKRFDRLLFQRTLDALQPRT
ncbi:MAG TPA: ferritin-like domain-containing protein [Polyangiales bacterium]|nr:ferritin-like domain-containing protein [Polyangiales bacterium]